MRVFVAGATGVLGKRIIAKGSQRGHDVLGLTRDEAGDDTVKNQSRETVLTMTGKLLFGKRDSKNTWPNLIG